MRILVTGAAGFIGSHLSARLISDGHEVVGVDNLYCDEDKSLKDYKLDRLHHLVGSAEGGFRHGFTFHEIDITDRKVISNLFETEKFDIVIHLAARTGVRNSVENPADYIEANIVGFFNVIDGARISGVSHFIYASSSSVYGLEGNGTLTTGLPAVHPVSLYGATKKSDELIAHSYSVVYGLPTTGLRFFTVYGPWGRKDMAPLIFAEAIINGSYINVYNHGEMWRDFTYIDDVVSGVTKVVDSVIEEDEKQEEVPYGVYNIGRGEPVRLIDFITLLENALGGECGKNFIDMQPGDMIRTCADMLDFSRDFSFSASVGIEEGTRRMAEWLKDYKRINKRQL